MIGTLSPDMGHTIKIETYWNVNISEMNKEQLMRFIKIETYWNVNTNSLAVKSHKYVLK